MGIVWVSSENLLSEVCGVSFAYHIITNLEFLGGPTNGIQKVSSTASRGRRPRALFIAAGYCACVCPRQVTRRVEQPSQHPANTRGRCSRQLFLIVRVHGSRRSERLHKLISGGPRSPKGRVRWPAQASRKENITVAAYQACLL